MTNKTKKQAIIVSEILIIVKFLVLLIHCQHKKTEAVRWTFILLYEPAWKNPSESFLGIEELLKDREYTFIAGHLHYYDLINREDRDYITMGPAGASWHKDGDGNVDHFLWVTMSEGAPEIAKVTLNGIYDRNGRGLQLKDLYER